MTQTPTEIRSLAPTIAQMRAHIVRVCKANKIEINYERHASASYRPPEIWIRPIRSPRAYAIALHEIGHIIGRYQMKSSAMVRERWAWEWARRNALQWTPAMEQHAERCLKSYAAEQLSGPNFSEQYARARETGAFPLRCFPYASQLQSFGKQLGLISANLLISLVQLGGLEPPTS
jgi:hypothetical protein